MTRSRLPALLIPLAALVVVLPLLRHGASCGHDLNFHLLSWQEAARQFRHGTLYPRWAASPAFGAGEPRFVFYPPLSWSLGGLLVLAAAALSHLTGLPAPALFALIPALYTWIALAAAGLSMHHLARRFVSPATALIVAVLYLANPYTLFTAFERTAFAELLAAALLPLLLAALLPSTSPPERPPHILPLALPLALLWLTNAPAAVIGSYTVASLVLLRLLSAGSRSRRWLLRPLLASALAFAFAAFYLVPALYERRWVQIGMAILPGLRPDDNTLFHHTADSTHDAVLLSASHLACLLLTITLVALLVAWLRRGAALRPRLFETIAGLSSAIAFLLTPWSLPLWHHLPQLAFLQFPWRLLALLAPLAALSVALALPSLRLATVPLVLVSLGLAALLSAPSFHSFRQACDPEDAPRTRLAQFQSPAGDEPTDEYTPGSADNDSLRDNNPPFRLLPSTVSDETPPPPEAQPGPAPRHLELSTPAAANLVLNLRDYPTWSVTLDGTPGPPRDHRADGLLTLPLAAGHHVILISHRTPRVELAADIVSVVSLSLALALPLARRLRRRRRAL